jgi:hypothetical protein
MLAKVELTDGFEEQNLRWHVPTDRHSLLEEFSPNHVLCNLGKSSVYASRLVQYAVFVKGK